MKKLIITITMVMTMMLALPYSAANAVDSLRGNFDLDKQIKKSDKSLKKKKLLKQAGGFERNYEQQPPLIPHSIEKDKITLKGNTCMKCHSAKNYEKEKAPKAGDSHYETRDGKTLKKVSARRYFCNQCHVPQLDANPLVQNNF